MTPMNLIPEELELAQQRRRRLRTWAVAVAVCLVVGAVVAAWKYRSFSSVDRAANAVTQEIAALDKQQQQVASAENLLQRWQGRLALQRRLTRYPAVADIAACLTRNSPEMLFLHQLQCAPPTTESTDRQPAPPLPQAAQMFKLKVPVPSASDGPPAPGTTTDRPTAAPFQLTLLGRAVNYHTVADFLEALRNQPLFRTVTLKRTARDPASTDTVDFEIQCLLNRPPALTGVDHASLPQTKNF